MINIKTEHIDIKGVSGAQIMEALLTMNDQRYQQWWPGTHLRSTVLRQRPGHVGDLVYIDEHIGKYRLKMKCEVVKAIPGKEVVFRVIKIIKAPIAWSIKFQDYEGGVIVDHEVMVGFGGLGSVFDFFFRLFATQEFAKAMTDHARTEFPRLSEQILARSQH